MDDRQTPAGWYPDPLGLPQLRWWDGQGWGEHTSEARRPLLGQQARSVAFADPADEEPLAPEPVEPEAPVAEAADPVVPPTPAPTTFASGPAALPAGPADAVQGWSGAALTIHSMRAAGVPTVLDVEISGHPSITIDTRVNAFSWQLELDRFPAEPAAVAVAVRIVEKGAPAAFELPGSSLDGLLWKMGFAAFPDELAPWLNAGDAYRLRRWPDLSGFEPDTDPLRQAAMLSNGVFTLEQLADFTGRSIEPTRSLLNALGLMGVLEVVAR
ncbi:DUF2510 domain-containing protein [Homoserinibacter gongjuensis]|jgi:hypothetical protein|uniref:DUF2510 domain-containing protein n=1 Tax=Homoserinibacter gongjuensis TaxID=1162968 RepID=A0ABQ6JPC9_9MICO|nr:DUF2510 domain-containing protein [Homoserinibacter gongjuensis]GMA89602.1 hypothetical protein GCM10025869_01310 [Homoserinibacter gongjuensis]